MARNKDLPTKLRRAKKLNQSRSVPTWVIKRTGGKVRNNPHSGRQWRNTRLKRD